MGRTVARILCGAVVPAALLVVWHWGSHRSVLVPGIGEVLSVLAHPFREPAGLDSWSLGRSVGISLLRVACGFALAALTAVPTGLLIGRVRWVRDMLGPTMAAALAVSPIAWFPVTIIVFGFSNPARVLYGDNAVFHDVLSQLGFAIIAVIWIGSFFPIATNVAAGAAGVRTSYLEAVRVYGATPWQKLTCVVLPAVAPSIVAGLRIGAGIAWRVIIAAELFPGTRGGVGYMIANSQETGGAYEYAFACIIVIAAVGLAIDALLRRAADRVGRWRSLER